MRTGTLALSLFVSLAAVGPAMAGWKEGMEFTTVVVTEYETVCPESTTFTHKNATYTATESETVTLTNCPCTVTEYTPPPYPTVTEYCPPGSNYTTTWTSTYTPEPTTCLEWPTEVPTNPMPPTTTITHPMPSMSYTPPPVPSMTSKPPPVATAAADRVIGNAMGALGVGLFAAMV